jgi:heme-degrading monooxygenase HmoA
MSEAVFATLPPPPYYAVIFSSTRTAGDQGYGAMAEAMVSLAAKQPGFLGVESVRGAEGFGITVSYWRDLEAIRNWKAVAEHREAQALGQSTWYQKYHVRIARIDRAYDSGPELGA